MIRKNAWIHLVLALGAVAWLAAVPAVAQETDESPAEAQYRQDYDRVNKVMAISDPMKRADALLDFIRERPNSKLEQYAQANYLQILDSLSKGEKFQAVLTLSERLLKLRPRVGEAYYFYGAALRNMQRYPEAIDALAKAAVIKSPAQRKAREFLEFVYKGRNQNSTAGLEKILKKAEADVNK